MDLFLLTSRLEGLPNALIEAQAMGIPVVTTSGGGSAEALAPGLTGVVVSDDSPAGVARTCLGVLATAAKARMAAAAPIWVRKQFSLERLAENTMAVYGMAPAPLHPDETAAPASLDRDPLSSCIEFVQ